jgi:protein required for attachment to host cells
MEDLNVCYGCPTQDASEIIAELDTYCCADNKIYSRARTDILTIASKLFTIISQLTTRLQDITKTTDLMDSLKTFVSDKFEELTAIASEPSKDALDCLKTTAGNLTSMEKAIKKIPRSSKDSELLARIADQTPNVQSALGNIDLALTSADENQRRQIAALDGLVTNSFSDLKKHLDSKLSLVATASPNTISKGSEPSIPTFASITKGQRKKTPSPKADYSIVVQPKDKQQTSDATKQHIFANFNPVTNKVGINRVVKRKDGAVLLNVDTEQSLKILQSQISKIASTEYSIKQTTRRNPRLQIQLVPTAYTDDKILEAIHQQNETIASHYPEHNSFKAGIKIVLHQKTNRQDHQNLVIEATPKLRRLLLLISKVRICWSVVEVRDFILVTRCFKCCDFGHTANNCRSAHQHCSHCTGDHKLKDCPQKSDTSKQRCNNCSAENERNKNSAQDES